jgi:hypothetical protein
MLLAAALAAAFELPAGAGGVPGWTHDTASKRATETRVIWFRMGKS